MGTQRSKQCSLSFYGCVSLAACLDQTSKSVRALHTCGRTSTSMRAFCMAASCCTWRMTAVLGSLEPNESMVEIGRVGGGKMRGAGLRIERASLGGGLVCKKLATSRAALLASVVPQRKTPALHAEVIEWPFRSPRFTLRTPARSSRQPVPSSSCRRVHSAEASLFVSFRSIVFIHSFGAPIAPW